MFALNSLSVVLSLNSPYQHDPTYMWKAIIALGKKLGYCLNVVLEVGLSGKCHVLAMLLHLKASVKLKIVFQSLEHLSTSFFSLILCITCREELSGLVTMTTIDSPHLLRHFDWLGTMLPLL